MANRKVHIDELPLEARERIKKRLPGPGREEITRATVAVLHALAETGLQISAWSKVLDTAKQWLGRGSTRKK